jgi:hypothetical protein
MKKFLLLISVMLLITSIKAQDVYTSGSFKQDNTIMSAAVYRNNQRLYYINSTGDYEHESPAVVVKSNNVYWVDNAVTIGSHNYHYGDVFKNSTRYLSNPTSTHTHINDLFIWNNMVFSVGCHDVNGVRTAVIWRENEIIPHYTLGDGVNPSEATCGVASGNAAYIGGTQVTSSGNVGTIWRNSEVLYTMGYNTNICDIAVYNDNVISLGYAYENGDQKLRVWFNSAILYTLNQSTDGRGSIYIDGGDIYVASSGDSSYDKIWKNGEEIYSTGGFFYGVAANSNGVYAAGATGTNGRVWENGSIIYSPENSRYLEGIFVTEPECEDSDIHTLPYTESFETGSTDWACWTKLDVDEDNGPRASYWDRCGMRVLEAPTGDYCAAHMYGPSEKPQVGWLISPRLFLQPRRTNTQLEFKSFEGSSGTTSMKVLVSTNSNPTILSSYTEVYSITNQTDDWTTHTVNLEDYQGQSIYIAFKYEGTYAKNWYIDDISVTESYNMCPVNDVPYYEDFSSNLGSCWYIIDNDHSGDGRWWKYNDSEQCAYHPWGQQNMPQEGWMFSPSVTLPGGHNYQLSFLTKNSSSGTGMNSSVWIALDETGTPDPANYTTMLWEESTSSSWHSVNIDLTEYAGHEVRIAFKYEGTYAHAWYVDDFAIEQNTIQYNINVVANNPDWGTVTGGATYEQGASVTITATPNSGYDFLKWTKDGNEVSTLAIYSFTATEDATYTAVFGEQAVTYYTITTAASPAEAGTVTGGDTYPEGATATLAVSANTGWQFVQWTDGNADNPRTITVTGDATYTAQFTQIDYAINVDAMPYEGGIVTGSGTYHYGDAVTLTATPNEGYDFLQWDNGETDNTRIVIVDGDANYTAYFAEQGTNTYEIVVSANDSELGTVTGGGIYPEGAVITITATPIGYATFVKWDDGNTDATRTITVTANATYTAIFEMGALYTITVESLDPTMGTVAGGGEFPSGAEIVIQATPLGGYHFDGWDDNVYDNPRTVIVTGNATYKARFSETQVQTYHITVMCNANEGTVIGDGDYPVGTEVTIAAIPNAGYRFKDWNDGVTTNPRTITVTSNATYFATFVGDSVDENNAQSLNLYPNPANDVIRLEGIGENTEVRIYNTVGALVKVVTISDGEEISISDLGSGIYIVRSGNTMLKFTKK